MSIARLAPPRAFGPVAGRIGGAVGLLSVVALWELLARTALASSLVVPTPFVVARQLWDDRSFLVPHVETTLYEAALGFFWGNLIAIAVGVVFVLVPTVHVSPPLGATT